MKQAERYLNEGTHPRVLVEVTCCLATRMLHFVSMHTFHASCKHLRLASISCMLRMMTKCFAMLGCWR